VGPPQVPAFTGPGVDPYRILFPLGLLYGLLAALVWPLHVSHVLPYPADMHWTLMIQGFVHCFILGFLLTALPAFLHADRCHRTELGVAVASMVVLGAATLAGWHAVAQGAYLLTLATLVVVAARRIPVRRGDPPEEFVFVAMGLLFGFGGGLWGLATAAGWAPEPAPRFPLRLISRGLVLCIVLGVGGLLVPTFAAMKDPLVVLGIAKPGQRHPRRRAYIPLALLFAAALVAEGYGRANLGSWLRVAAATPILLLVWKLFRLPGRRDLLSFTLWGAGWFLGIGLWFSALVPAHAIAGFHIMFLGGFGLLILGIATRVVVTHGKYPLQYERSILRVRVVALVLLALALRLAGDFSQERAMHFYAGSGTLWILAWLDWGWRAVPCMFRKPPETVVMERLKYVPKR
jgi:uncharacterized protein involved in response to NO